MLNNFCVAKMFFVKSFLCKCNNKMHLYKEFLCVLKLQSVTPLYNTACNPCNTIQTLFNVLNIFCVAKMFFVKSFLCKCNNKMYLYKKFLCCTVKKVALLYLYNIRKNITLNSFIIKILSTFLKYNPLLPY